MIVLRIIGRRRALVSVPFAVAELQARLFELLPNPPLTTGQEAASAPMGGIAKLAAVAAVIASDYEFATHRWSCSGPI